MSDDATWSYVSPSETSSSCCDICANTGSPASAEA
eukprot:CAMPEP_0175985328 /NCGR_PEP_ID=MMETSP0108-20121206/49500_1 /TAXON_ID=195067 ORGANISM="Goniomonas pacifica, Strain CCMP1869" /NCGR_SAMPLE_ID=MMETSP0108 /ASSEMBLY_ACC=CAM_ASM_000204 /LENGTH=34 /DNA_ID= /DNA_START= /DNA_END= /DNA_ORIENTATION=